MREGRRQEFAGFAEFADPEKRERIPDPNAAETFAASVPQTRSRAERFALYQRLIALRMQRDRAAVAGHGIARRAGDRAEGGAARAGAWATERA